MGYRGVVRVLLSALLLASALSCSSRPPSRCELVCRHEDTCAHELKVDFDLAECIEACKSLDRDSSYQAAVERHVRCVDAAAECTDVLACQ